MNEGDEAKLTYWYDVLEEIYNGRPEGHSCPFCGQAGLEVETEGFRLRVECKHCGEYFEGRRPW
jgi:transcription elongation factor Elf1